MKHFEGLHNALEAQGEAIKSVAETFDQFQRKLADEYIRGRNDVLASLVGTGHQIIDATGAVVTKRVLEIFNAIEILKLLYDMETMDGAE